MGTTNGCYLSEADVAALPAAKFQLGQVVATPGALEALGTGEIASALARHSRGDWGEMPEEDKRSNDRGLGPDADRLMSAYRSREGVKFWVITEWDRSVTTVLLPDEY